MEQYQTLIQTIALTAGAAWASGINLYAVLLVLGLGGASGAIALPDDLQVLQNPMVIGAAAMMYCVEFFADKIPGVDSGWDAIHTFVRIPAGAMLAAGAVGEVTPALEIAAAIMGGGVAATSHATKASSRMLINASPEPFTNWGASLAEDLLVLAGLWTALNHPSVFIVLLVLFLVVAIWLLPKMWRLVMRVLGALRRWLSATPERAAESPPLGAAPLHPQPALLTAPSPTGEQPPSEPATSSAETLSLLERLQALRSSGALSEEEFNEQKRRLLGR